MYDDMSFMQGLACGLSATAGRPLGRIDRIGATGHVQMHSVPNQECNVFVSRVWMRTPCHATILYEYGVNGGEKTRVFRTVRASAEKQTFYHVYRRPQKINLRQFNYSVYILIRENTDFNFTASFMAFPITQDEGTWSPHWVTYEYPGSPELVDKWITWTAR